MRLETTYGLNTRQETTARPQVLTVRCRDELCTNLRLLRAAGGAPPYDVIVFVLPPTTSLGEEHLGQTQRKSIFVLLAAP